MDDDTCDECAYYNATDATPPHDGCTSKLGCRCQAVPEDDDAGSDE